MVNKSMNFLVVILAVFLLSFFVVWKGLLVLFVFLLVLLVLFLSYRLDIGWYILIFLSPLLGWEINLSNYWYLFNNYPRLLDINGPVVDFWLIIMFSAFVLHVLRQLLTGKEFNLKLPGFPLFLLFVLSAVLSLGNVHPLFMNYSIKYLLRFIVLFYFGFVVLGVNIITTKEILKNSLMVLVGTAVLAAFMGAVSFLLGTGVAVYGLPRSTPFSIGGWAPFGLQHIFLAEVITTALPILLFFWYQSRDRKNKVLWGWLTFSVLVVGLFTLSRAAWLTLFCAVLIFIYLTKEYQIMGRLKKYFKWLLWLLMPLLVYIIIFMAISPAVSSSTSARWLLTDISFYLFFQHPWLGVGVGNFVTALSDNHLFLVEVGTITDAHGIIQKIISEQGIFGLLSFGLFVGWFFVNILRRYQDKRYSVEARLQALLGVFLIFIPLFFQLFSTQYYTGKLWVPISLAIAGNLVYKHNKKAGHIVPLYDFKDKKVFKI